MKGSNNFRNIVKSLMEKSIMYETSLSTCDEHVLFSKDLSVGKAKMATDILFCKRQINSFSVTDINTIDSVHITNWIIFHGQKYIKDQCLVAFGEQNDFPEFGHVTIKMTTRHR